MIFPLRFRRLKTNELIFANDAGDFFLSDDAFLDRYASDTLSRQDRDFLQYNGHIANREDDIFYLMCDSF